MSDLGFFLGFFLVIIFLALTVGRTGEGIFSDTGTSTPAYETAGATDAYYSADESYVPNTAQIVEEELSPEDAEARVAEMYRNLDELKEEARAARLREPRSPYSTYISLSRGNVSETDPDEEYLTLAVSSDAPGSINISNWKLESYVTERSARIPQGDRVMERWRSPLLSPIVLLRSESAYIITGDSPLEASFRENMCTGYLNDEEKFPITLSERCPHPEEELERYGKIELDNDRCYEFIEQLPSCTNPENLDTYSRSRVGSACNTFIEQTFNYNDCVRLHKDDPYFSRDGYWHIYLERSRELWRPEREIIRLLDEQNRVVSVIEY